MDLREVLIAPVVSEKSYSLLEDNVYTFQVANDATKPQIKQAVETLFEVTVLKVNTLNRKGKRQRNRRSGAWGQRSDVKRAMVTLADGDEIDLFEV